MRIDLDIASLANKHQLSRIVLIAGDSDFVPAAKRAREEGIDFILDPLWQPIKAKLNEHIDGLRSCTKKCRSQKGVHCTRTAMGIWRTDLLPRPSARPQLILTTTAIASGMGSKAQKTAAAAR